jgi:phytoene synthase
MDAQDAECLAVVRAGDKDRFLASLFAPGAVRPHLLAIYAFNVELARIRDVVSEPRIGAIRLQWWRAAMASIIAGEPPPHPVAQALARAIAAGKLERSAFEGMLAAREFDLYDDPMPSLNDLEGYLGETASMLFQFGARLLAGEGASVCASASGLAGVAYGLTGLLRSLPLHRARGQCYVPRDLLESHGLSPAHVIAGRDDAALAAVLKVLRDHAARRLAEARAELPRLPREALPAFLPLALVEGYLAQLERLGTGALRQVAEVPQYRRQFILWWKARKNIF